MMKRDLKADLELCNKATPGPWEFERPWEFGPIYAGAIADALDEERDRANRELLNNFREGWPHAIERALKAEALARELVDMLGRVIPRYLVERLELDLDLVLEANGLLKNPKEVLSDDKVHAGRQSKGAKDY